MIEIDGVLIDEDVVKSNFSCDLKQCKGACCTFPGESGAPLLKDEIAEITNVLEEVKKYLSERSLKEIEEFGFYEKNDDDLSTRCIDKKDCVFVIYDNDIAKCGIEKAYFNGDIKYRKPISCHLFPIREGYYGGKYIFYERFQECIPGMRKGERENTRLLESLEEALKRAYGSRWYDKLVTKIDLSKIK